MMCKVARVCGALYSGCFADCLKKANGNEFMWIIVVSPPELQAVDSQHEWDGLIRL